ncbi:MAG: hypothetical protein K2N39_02820, partial [Lachnospiraceae bacterium]|nr:hypothetical protein [Lachnospiraceae bacterium]
REDNTCNVSNFYFDESCDPGQLIGMLRSRYPGIPEIPRNQPGYYLADKKDGIRIARLLEMGYSVRVIRKYVLDAIVGEVVDCYPLIASSGNHFPLEGEGGVRDRYVDPPALLPRLPIFYISPDAQGNSRWIQLPED